MPQAIIKLEDVSYSYLRSGCWALNKINLEINRGELLAVMGRDGAGKSTFCKLINGIIPHSLGGRLLGNVVVDGINTANSSVPELARRVGMVLDDPQVQLFTSTVRNEAAFGPENLLLPPDEIERRVKYALESAGLAGFEERAPATLSGGEQQRLVIAAAIAMAEKILVMDDPTCRLDPGGVTEFFSVLTELRKKYQLTMIMATHDSERVLEYADRVCILSGGAVAACGAPRDIFGSGSLLCDNGIRPAEPCTLACLPAVQEQKPAAVRIAGLSHSYDSVNNVLENVNLSIYENDFAAIIGQNGCGKTTLLKSICGLLRPTSGEIFVGEKNISGVSVAALSAETGLVMQNPDAQLFTNTVYKEVSFALRKMGLTDTEIRLRADAALAAAGLEEHRDSFPPALDRAGREKTALAAVIAMGCKIILLDEPGLGQDYQGSRSIMNIAKGLHSQGCTIIFVTHNMYLAAEYAQRLILMHGKGVLMDGTPRDIFSRADVLAAARIIPPGTPAL